MSLTKSIIIILAMINFNVMAKDASVKLNRILLGAGLGLDGLVHDKKNNLVKERLGSIVSVDYERSFSNSNIIGISVLSNKTVVIKLGKEF